MIRNKGKSEVVPTFSEMFPQVSVQIASYIISMV